MDNEFLHKCFSRAVFDVFTTMVGQEPCEIPKNQPKRGSITGVMMLLGESNALMSLNLDRGDMEEVVSYMTGNLVEELQEEDLYDGIAELVNMIAGRAKALLAGTGYHYKLTPPLTIVGDNHFVVYKKKTPDLAISFSLGDIHLQLELIYV